MTLLDQYDEVCNEFKISEKVFKIVSDSAANNVCAFANEPEAVDETFVLAKIIAKQRKSDTLKNKKP